MQIKHQNMEKSVYKCPVCNGTHYEVLSAEELEKIDPIKYAVIIEKHIEAYGSIDVPAQLYTIPCRKCNMCL